MIYLSHACHKHVVPWGTNIDINAKKYQKSRLFRKANDRFTLTYNINTFKYFYQWLYQQKINRLSDDKLVLKGLFISCINEEAHKEEFPLYVLTS